MSTTQQLHDTTGRDVRNHRPLGSRSRVNAEVREVTRGGRDYLVFPIVALREMVIDYPENGTRELLARDRLHESEQLWAGTPLTFIHPENDEKTADKPESFVREVIGQVFRPEVVDDEKLKVQAWLDVQKARDIGGLAEEVVDRLMAGENLSVSAGYATIDDKYVTGTHNGDEYDVEQGILLPDHVAVFPSDQFKARCDWDDGCGAPRANYVEAPSDVEPTENACECDHDSDDEAMVTTLNVPQIVDAYVTTNALEDARTPTYDGLTSGEWEPPSFTEYVNEWASRTDSDLPDQPTMDSVPDQAKQFTANRTLVGDPDADSTGDLVAFPVVNLDDELNENALQSALRLAGHAGSDSTKNSIQDRAESLLESAPDDGEWPSGKSYGFSDDQTQNAADASGVADTTDSTNSMTDQDDDPATHFQRFLSSLGLSQGERQDGVGARANTAPDSADGSNQESEAGSGDDETTTDDAETTTNAEDGGSEVTDDEQTETDTDTMSNEDDKTNQQSLTVEDLAQHTMFSVETLEQMDEEMLETLEQEVIQELLGSGEGPAAEGETSGDGGSSGGEEQQANAQETDDGGDTDTVTNNDEYVTEEQLDSRLDEFEQNVTNSFEETLEEQFENFSEQKQNAQKREQQARIVANAIEGMTVNAAKELPDEELESLAEKHGGERQRANMAGVPGQMNRNFETEPDEAEYEDYPGGGRSDYEARKQGGD